MKKKWQSLIFKSNELCGSHCLQSDTDTAVSSKSFGKIDPVSSHISSTGNEQVGAEDSSAMEVQSTPYITHRFVTFHYS